MYKPLLHITSDTITIVVAAVDVVVVFQILVDKIMFSRLSTPENQIKRKQTQW